MRRSSLLFPGMLAVAALLLFSGCADANLFEMMTHGWGLGLCGTVIVVMDVIAILEIVGSDRTFGSKAVWSLIIVFFPLLGLIFYWLFG